MLLPPIVSGPLTTASPGVWVSGALEGAVIRLVSNDTDTGVERVASGLSTFVEVPAGTLQAGARIGATQSKAGASSAATPQGQQVVVAALPTQDTGLPAVVFLSVIHPWVDWVVVGGLIPGCTVELFHDGAQAGSAIAIGSVASVPFNPQGAPSAGDTVEARQTLRMGSATVLMGPKTSSLPLAARDRLAPAAPTLTAPLECDLAVLVAGVENGASLVVNHGAEHLAGYAFVGSPVWAGLLKPARPGDTFTAEQAFTRWDMAGPVSVPPVSVVQVTRMPTPRVHGPLCQDAQGVALSNLRPGATVSVTARRKTDIGGVGILLGQFRAWATDCTTPLPHGWGQDPRLAVPGQLLIEAVQENCDKGSDSGSCGVGPLPVGIGVPSLHPSVACARWVVGSGLTPGAWVALQSQDPQWPQLAQDVPVISSQQAIPVGRPLRAGERIRLRQHGCGANRESEWVEVGAFSGVGTPTILPVRIPHGGVYLGGLMPGARVHVFVNGSLRASMDVTAASQFVPLAGLEREQKVRAVQTMCSAIGTMTGEETVTLGRIKITDILPSPITRSQPTTIRVTALDADLGTPVAGSIVIGTTIVGATNTPFAHTFAPGPAPPSSVVAHNYFGEAISWPLADPVPVQSRLILILANHSGGAFGIEDVAWRVYKQVANAVSEIAQGTGVSCAIALPAAEVGSTLHLIATVTTVNGATGEEEVAAFIGNNPAPGINGQATFMLVLAAGDRTIHFSLINDPVWVSAGGAPYPINKAMVKYESG